MPFGNDLWDKFPQTEQYVHEGIDFMGVFEEFVKRKSELEKDYAKALKKLVKPVKETLEKKTKGTQLRYNRNSIVILPFSYCCSF